LDGGVLDSGAIFAGVSGSIVLLEIECMRFSEVKQYWSGILGTRGSFSDRKLSELGENIFSKLGLLIGFCENAISLLPSFLPGMLSRET
jgi:hypothetical protein